MTLAPGDTYNLFDPTPTRVFDTIPTAEIMPRTHRNYGPTRITSAPQNDANDQNSTQTFAATLPTERLNFSRRRKPAPNAPQRSGPRLH